jgi:hypothetical protein
MTTIMPNERQLLANKWVEAIQDTQNKMTRLERELARLRAAVRIMKRQLKDGVPWPEGAAEEKADAGEPFPQSGR